MHPAAAWQPLFLASPAAQVHARHQGPLDVVRNQWHVPPPPCLPWSVRGSTDRRLRKMTSPPGPRGRRRHGATLRGRRQRLCHARSRLVTCHPVRYVIHASSQPAAARLAARSCFPARRPTPVGDFPPQVLLPLFITTTTSSSSASAFYFRFRISPAMPLFVLSPASLAHSALFAGYYSYLTANVFTKRYKTGYYIGEGQDDNSSIKDPNTPPVSKEDKLALIQAVRAHGNFLEFTPLAFGLIFLAELNGAPTALVHAGYVTLFTLRVLHASFGILKPGADSLGRKVGALGTTALTLSVGLYNVRMIKLHAK